MNTPYAQPMTGPENRTSPEGPVAQVHKRMKTVEDSLRVVQLVVNQGRQEVVGRTPQPDMANDFFAHRYPLGQLAGHATAQEAQVAAETGVPAVFAEAPKSPNILDTTVGPINPHDLQLMINELAATSDATKQSINEQNPQQR